MLYKSISKAFHFPHTLFTYFANQITITNPYFSLAGDGCVEKPLATLWRNYTQSSRPDVCMQLTVSGGGLKATTRDHGLTEYWAHRLTTCAAPAQFPRLFCWVYRHEGRRLRHELRCHAVLCPTTSIAKQIETHLKNSLALALAEFKRDKISRQNARLSLANCVYENPTMPRRKILLSTGSHNYRPPLERSKSAPKLTSIEENLEEDEEIFEGRPRNTKILRHSDSTGVLLDKRKALFLKLAPPQPVLESVEDDREEETEEETTKDTYSRVKFSDDDDLLDEKSNMILAQLAQDAMRNDLIESCERSWFRKRDETPDLIPLDSDEGSLSSGCESVSTVTSDSSEPSFPTISEENETKKKTELDFKIGGCVLSRVRDAEPEVRRYSGLGLLENDEVSLIPVGETQSDFSSLKVYKKRASLETGQNLGNCDCDDGEGSEEENGSACSDESGYDEAIDCMSSVSNVILV